MEKQLLYLLDWDLNFSLEELTSHFEPFLAPIREQMELKAERRRNERRLHAYAKAREEAHRESIARASVITAIEPAVLATPMPTYRPATAARRAAPLPSPPNFSRVTRSTVRSVSPPSATDIPPLSRSGTSDSYASTPNSSRASSRSRSRSQTPSSVRSLGSEADIEAQHDLDGSYVDNYVTKHHGKDIIDSEHMARLYDEAVQYATLGQYHNYNSSAASKEDLIYIGSDEHSSARKVGYVGEEREQRELRSKKRQRTGMGVWARLRGVREV